MTWDTTGPVFDTWGRLQVVTGGKDVTFFRDKPCIPLSYGSSEPFGDETMVIRFPQITPFEHIGTSPLDWLGNGQNIELKVIYPNMTSAVIWTGQIVSLEGHSGETDSGLDLHCRGAIFSIDNGLKQPGFDYRERDIGYVIAEAFNRYIGRSHGECEPVVTGITTRTRGAWTPVATGFVQDLLATATVADGSNQWTVKQQHRTPVIELKDRTTIHFTLTTGQVGLTVDLAQDITGAPNVIYGEGISPDGQHWRRTKYPNYFDTIPAFPLSVGSSFSPGGSDTGFQDFSDELRANGYPTVTSQDTYLTADEDEVKEAQKRAGCTVDGLVGAQTWNAVFDTGDDVGNLNGAYCAPLAWDTRVEPYIYNARGAKIGDNPDYDPTVVRVERYENFGEGITLHEGILSARAELARVSEPGWSGTAVLRIDPAEMSRFEIRAGMNGNLKSWQGLDRTLHVASAQANLQDLSVTLTWDTHARDALTLAAIHSRDTDAATDPVRRDLPMRRRSRQVIDQKVIWDAESGAGIVREHNLQAGLFTAKRFPAGGQGNVNRTVYTTTSPASKFFVAVFSLPVTPADGIRLFGSNPLSTSTPGIDFTDEMVAAGILAMWGSLDQAMGYYPKTQDMVGATITGRFDEQSPWPYESQRPPWLWVLEWAPVSCKISGHFYAEPDA